MRFSWPQVKRVRVDSLDEVSPLINQDMEWNRKRSGIVSYLLIGYGVAAVTGFQLLFGSNVIGQDLRKSIGDALFVLSIGFIFACVSFVFDLWSEWLSMRNRKRILADGAYSIGALETATSVASAIFSVIAVAIFAYSFYAIFGRGLRDSI